MAATFDGDNLLIILESAKITLDAQIDLYSDWKEWFKTDDNAKYPRAFRDSVGGDDINATLQAGDYYFFQNQLGWRIRPPEEDINILFTGNFIPEDPTLPMFIPTLGGFTVLILGLQPITQGTDLGAQVIENGVTVGDILRILLAADGGDVSGAATNTINIQAADGSKTRITATVDANGNRTVTLLDGSV